MIISNKQIWFFASLVTIFYPFIAIFIGNSFAHIIPLVLSWFFIFIFVFLGSRSLPFWLLFCLGLFPSLFFSSILNSTPLLFLASIKVYSYLRSFLVFLFLVLRKFSLYIITKLVDQFFNIILCVCLFSALEVFSRFFPLFESLFSSYFLLINASGMQYLEHGAVAGLFAGSNSLGFYGDLHTAVGLSVVSFFYFTYKKKYLRLLLAFIALACTLSISALLTALLSAFILIASRSSILSVLRPILVLVASLFLFELTFTGHLTGKLFGNSFSTVFGHFVTGLSQLEFSDLLVGSGYASQGFTMFYESAFVEYIYMSGLLVHILPLIFVLFACLASYKLSLNPPPESLPYYSSAPRGLFQFLAHAVCLMLIYVDTIFHCNQFFNPVVSYSFSILILLPYFSYAKLHYY